jgi:hypothetical protein
VELDIVYFSSRFSQFAESLTTFHALVERQAAKSTGPSHTFSGLFRKLIDVETLAVRYRPCKEERTTMTI